MRTLPKDSVVLRALIIVLAFVFLGYVLLMAWDIRELRSQGYGGKASCAKNSARVAYAQLSSDVTQRATSSKPAEMQMRLRGTIRGVEFDPSVSTTDVKILHDGIYFLMAAPQVGRLNADASKSTCANFFFTVNNKPLPDSNVTRCLPTGDPDAKDVIVAHNIHALKAGDEVSVMIATTGTEEGIGIESLAPEDQPIVPSMLFSLFLISGEN